MYVYAIETPTYIKIGHWSGSISALQARYATSIPYFETTVFQTLNPIDAERKLHRECHPFHIRGEMFAPEALGTFYSVAVGQSEIFCTSADLEKKKTACLRARYKKLLKETAALTKANERLVTANERLLDENIVLKGGFKKNIPLKKKTDDGLQQIVAPIEKLDTLDSVIETQNGRVVAENDGTTNEPFATFIREHYRKTENEKDRVAKSEVNDSFMAWCEARSLHSLITNQNITYKHLKVAMSDLGFPLGEKPGNNGRLKHKTKRVKGTIAPAFSYIAKIHK